jgi:hypothetical protein
MAFTTRRPTVPWLVWVGAAGFGVVAAYSLAALIVDVARVNWGQYLAMSVHGVTPPAGLSVAVVVLFYCVNMMVLVVLPVWFGLRAVQGRSWARIGLAIYTAVFVVLTIGQGPLVIGLTAVQVLAAALFWTRASNRYFTTARKYRRTVLVAGTGRSWRR